MKSKIAIIGGGFFGSYLAYNLSKRGYEVFIFEKECQIMQRASLKNQARVHNGYHYPRSILTGLRSRISFPRFINEFPECIEDKFEKLYLISSQLSKINSIQFENYCNSIGANYYSSYAKFSKYINKNLIDNIYSVDEVVFNSEKLKNNLLNKINKNKIKLYLNTEISGIAKINNQLSLKYTNNDYDYIFDHVFNCTYSNLNQLIYSLNKDLIPLKHELTEICLIEAPSIFNEIGITIMDGPFFSMMPYPILKSLHTFSHVRYTPHIEWHDDNIFNYNNFFSNMLEEYKLSAWKHMINDAKRYIPMLQESNYKNSLWEIKTVLPKSEYNDSRPILFKPNYCFHGFHQILGGKIDNVYDVIDIIEKTKLL